MYSTAKEVHVYIDLAIQQLASNRKQSIAPEHIDMVLNNAVPEYISSRFPNSYNIKDIEDTLKRYTDFSVLKRSITDSGMISESENVVRFIKPANSIKIQSVSCKYIRPFNPIKNIGVARKYKGIITISDDIYKSTDVAISIIYSKNGVTVSKNISFNTFIKKVKSENSVFYLYDNMLDILRNVYDLNAHYNSFNENGKRQIIIDFPVGCTLINLTTNNVYVNCKVEDTLINSSKLNAGKISNCSIMSEINADISLSDFYRSRNLHLDPIVTIESDSVDIHYTDFLPTFAEIKYLKKPRLFNIATGQIPEINITKDFLDYAVKEFELLLNSGNFEKVVNENIRNL